MRQCIIFDADDTLWENNIYFERAIEEFEHLLRPLNSDHKTIRMVLSEVERVCIPQKGYGSQNFIHALRETFRRLYKGDDGREYLKGIERIGDRLLTHPIELLAGVEETLQELRCNFHVMLFTKGDREEQMGKLERSGLRVLFERIEVADEKDTAAYRELIVRHNLPTGSTFMVGNSPRSDVLPALAAGLWAIFIPHPHTWEMENHPLEPHPRLLIADAVRAVPSLLSGLGHGPR